MRPYASFVVFVVVLIILKRVLALPISIGGSIVLTIVVWFIVRSLDSGQGE